MTSSAASLKFFAPALLQWHESQNDRMLPWKGQKDPYKIWLSEIILQQTRVAQGIPYYQAFITKYPTIHNLSEAPDDEVFRLWQGLGYYNRCRNMLHTARYISRELKGVFPNQYEDILKLKGVGAYTAAAIASFAFNQPAAVVDGNVIRVLARIFGQEEPSDSAAGISYFRNLADALLSKKHSAAYNQAIMDFGATLCTPKLAKCNECPFQSKCYAYKHNSIDLLPFKAKKNTLKQRYFTYIALVCKQQLWLQQRLEKDIWQGLYQPYLLESAKPLSPKQLIEQLRQFNSNITLGTLAPVYKSTQKLSHQQINATFYTISVEDPTNQSFSAGKWVAFNDLKKIAFPKTVLSFLEKNFYF